MTPEKALELMAARCSRREYCSGDVRTKLEEWGLTPEEAGRILDFLQHHGFVDDRRFAAAYTEDKFRFNRWGRRKIILMLRHKGIDGGIISEVVGNLDGDSWRQGCLELLRQKYRSLPDLPPLQLRARLTRFAVSRGFDYELVAGCIDELTEA